jgi:hypothetical protein
MLGTPVKAVDLASQVLTYWETVDCIPQHPEALEP